jgi:glutathione S-transferase
MQPLLLFYALPVSGYSAKVRITLAAKGIAYEEREPPGGYRSAAYRAIVPMGTVPAIVAGELMLSESETIAEYLEERFPEPRMLPQAPELRARVRFLSRFHDLHLEPAVRGLFAHVDPRRRDESVVDARARDIADHLGRLEGFVAPCPFALTPWLSLADCGFATTLPLARLLLEATGRALILSPRLERWLAAIDRHPAVASALAQWQPATEAWLAGQLGAASCMAPPSPDRTMQCPALAPTGGPLP